MKVLFLYIATILFVLAISFWLTSCNAINRHRSADHLKIDSTALVVKDSLKQSSTDSTVKQVRTRLVEKKIDHYSDNGIDLTFDTISALPSDNRREATEITIGGTTIKTSYPIKSAHFANIVHTGIYVDSSEVDSINTALHKKEATSLHTESDTEVKKKTKLVQTENHSFKVPWLLIVCACVGLLGAYAVKRYS